MSVFNNKNFISFLVSICILFFMINIPSFAQDWAKPSVENLHRVDMRDLGYPNVNQIPENSSAVTSLMTASDGKIYGGTSGETAYLFIFDPIINKVRHLGKMKSEEHQRVFLTSCRYPVWQKAYFFFLGFFLSCLGVLVLSALGFCSIGITS